MEAKVPRSVKEKERILRACHGSVEGSLHYKCKIYSKT